MSRELELLIRKTALKDVEIWLNQQYLEIEQELLNIKTQADFDQKRLNLQGLEPGTVIYHD